MQCLFRNTESSYTLITKTGSATITHLQPTTKSRTLAPVYLASFSQSQLSWLGRLALPASCQCVTLHSVNNCTGTRLVKHSLRPSTASHLASMLPDSGRTIPPCSFEAFARLASGSATSTWPKSAIVSRVSCRCGAMLTLPSLPRSRLPAAPCKTCAHHGKNWHMVMLHDTQALYQGFKCFPVLSKACQQHL